MSAWVHGRVSERMHAAKSEWEKGQNFTATTNGTIHYKHTSGVFFLRKKYVFFKTSKNKATDLALGRRVYL